MSSWLVPRDLFDAYGEEVIVYMNTGNMHTCTMQGFLDQFASKCSWTYNALLAFSYYVAVRFRKGEKTLVRFEWILHAIPIVSGLVAAIIPLPYTAYNHAGGAFCWLAVSPQGCGGEPKDGIEAAPCERGMNFGALRLWLSYIPIFVTQAVVLLSMLGVFCTVYKIEKKTDQYAITPVSPSSAAGRRNARRNRTRKRTKKVALKCALYVLAFEITWFFNVWGVIQFLADPNNDHETEGPNAGGWVTVKYMLNIAFLSSYGIWSSIAYFILPFLKVRKEHPEWSVLVRLRRTVLPPATDANGWMCCKNKRIRRFSFFGGTTHAGSEGVGMGISTSRVLIEPGKTFFEEEDNFGHDDDDDDDDEEYYDENITGNDEAGSTAPDIEIASSGDKNGVGSQKAFFEEEDNVGRGHGDDEDGDKDEDGCNDKNISNNGEAGSTASGIEIVNGGDKNKTAPDMMSKSVTFQ